MAEAIVCKVCGRRRAKRACPAVADDICSICCGEQREVTLACPLDCSFLLEARKHEKTVTPAEMSNPDVDITEDFLLSREDLLFVCIVSMVLAAVQTPLAVDTDVIEALAALIQTQRTADSGLIYESRSQNLVAASIQEKFSKGLDDYLKLRQQDQLIVGRSDADVFKILVFLHRLGQQNLNGRPKGRMFIDMLQGMTPEARVAERAPSIIL
jgi:hypothetical protein